MLAMNCHGNYGGDMENPTKYPDPLKSAGLFWVTLSTGRPVSVAKLRIAPTYFNVLAGWPNPERDADHISDISELGRNWFGPWPVVTLRAEPRQSKHGPHLPLVEIGALLESRWEGEIARGAG